MKSNATLQEVEVFREKMFNLFELVPDTGCYVSWMGLKLKVYPTVFWPHEDSMPLVNNYKINQGESVLDVCSGSGNIAIMSALKGAGSVVGLEHNIWAHMAANDNIEECGLNQNSTNRIYIRESDMFSALKQNERFDVITGNLPFTNKLSSSKTQTSMYDSNLRAHKLFFEGVDRHLANKGRIYLAHSDIGAMNEMLKMADDSGFKSKLIGEYAMKKPYIVFSAFELRRKR